MGERTKVTDRQFENHYELAAYILEKTLNWTTRPPLGAVDVLFAFLKEISRNRPADVNKYLETLPGASEARTVSEQIVDRLVQQNGKLYGTYFQVRKRLSDEASASGFSPSPEQSESDLAAGRFLRAWIRLERILRMDLKHLGPTRNVPLWAAVSKSRLGSHTTEFHNLRALRNRVFHGFTDIDVATLNDAVTRVNRLIERLKQ